ncbi:hypothetical protein EVC30_072 [Rhizobium phage RHph_Y1_11]|nr:hypothetical protein EVC30_072 [Rhizobium phage RHph_Y1_11]
MKYLQNKGRKTGPMTNYKTLQYRLTIKRVEAKPLKNVERTRQANIVDYAMLGLMPRLTFYWLSLIGRKTWREIPANEVQKLARHI